MSEDLPTLLRPIKAISGRSGFGAWSKDGLLITPFDPEFASAMEAYERGAKKYRNALRQLAR